MCHASACLHDAVMLHFNLLHQVVQTHQQIKAALLDDACACYCAEHHLAYYSQSVIDDTHIGREKQQGGEHSQSTTTQAAHRLAVLLPVLVAAD
jgi:hypothetical protein